MRSALLVSGVVLVGFLIFTSCNGAGQSQYEARKIPVEMGWAQSSVNAVIFRINSVDTFGDTQYISYYDEEGNVMIARRQLGSDEWEVEQTPFKGEVENAHNSISISVDGDGYVHMAWGLHDVPLQYVRSSEPGVLNFTDEHPMTGERESNVTYPQFYTLPDGDLLFTYRDGASGHGDIMLNRYDLEAGEWEVVAHPLIDGAGELSPYANPLAIDQDGGWHLSWNWRESWDVATNHDLAYAWSPDEGESWLTSAGDTYSMPIDADNADVVREIPQNSDLINQTSMAVDPDGNPVIATYWRPEGASAPQFHIIRFDDSTGEWHTSQVGERELDFDLSGGGTRRIPISRPLVLAGDHDDLYVVYRDFERGGGISVAVNEQQGSEQWNVTEIYADSIGMWEPTHDPKVWERDRHLHLFHQYVGQGQGETLEDIPPQEVSVFEWIPELYR